MNKEGIPYSEYDISLRASLSTYKFPRYPNNSVIASSGLCGLADLNFQ